MTKEQVYLDNQEAIDAFVRERDEVLLSGDLDRVIALHKKHNPDWAHNWGGISRKDLEVGMHKAITAVKSLPRQHRMQSKRWLADHGYKSWDDGDLTDS
jgi:hypothetical protein